jgi:hypothetical protein
MLAGYSSDFGEFSLIILSFKKKSLQNQKINININFNKLDFTISEEKVKKILNYILIIMIVLFVFGCMKIPKTTSKVETPAIPKGYKKVHIEKIKTDVVVPEDWNMVEKFNNWQIYLFTDISNPDMLQSIDTYTLTNIKADYENAGIALIYGQGIYFNDTDIKMYKNTMPNILEEKDYKEGNLDVKKLLLSDGYNYLQILSFVNKKSGKILRVEFRTNSENWETNKKMLDIILSNIKVNPNL